MNLRKQRLLDGISTFRPELELRVRQRRPPPGSWGDAARGFVEQAEEQAGQNRLNGAWESLLAARRALMAGYDESEVRAGADLLRSEAHEKLDGWRANAVERLLHDLESLRLEERRERLQKARLTLDQHLCNVYTRMDLRGAVLRQLVGVLAVLLPLCVWLLTRVPGEFEPGALLSSPWVVGAAMAYGALGATFSALLGLRGRVAGKIPDRLAAFQYTAVRPLVGAGAALLVVAALAAGVLGEATPGTPAPLLVFAAGSGVSEALVLKALTR